MLISHTDLNYFMALAETLNFSRAAENIGISQPSLSLAIQKLEQKIGTQLFIRTKYRVNLTMAGQLLLTHATKLVSYWHLIMSELVTVEKELKGSINLGCPESISSYLLKGFLPNLIKKYPKLELQLKFGNSMQVLENVLNYAIHIGILVNPTPHPDLIIHNLYRDKTVFWCSSSNQEIDLTNLNTATVIICNPHLKQTQWLLKYLHKNDVHYSHIIAMENYELIAELVAADCGVGIAPVTIMQNVNNNQIKQLPGSVAYHDNIGLVYRKEFQELQIIKILSKALYGAGKAVK